MKLAKFRQELPLHLMILPTIIFLFVFAYVPMFGIAIAFEKYVPTLGILKSKWVGMGNFTYLMNLPNTFEVLWNTVYIAFMKLVGGIIVPVIFALLLNEVGNKAYKRTVQTIIYLPYFLSWVILAGIFLDLLSPSDGIVNSLIKGLGGSPIFFLGNSKWFPNVMIVTDIWKGFGFGTIVYLAALTGIDPNLYEASSIDGAGRWKQTWHITMPGILPIVVLMTVLALGNVLNAGFDQIFNLYSPAVYSTGDIIDTFVYRLGLKSAQFGPSTAAGLFKAAVSFAFIMVSYKLADKFAGYRVF
jgi:putative aldouronate transport system permease protein